MTSKPKNFQNDLEIRQFLEKIVVNAGVGRMSGQSPDFAQKTLPHIVKDLSLITGQKPKICPARQSIAGFKLREGQIVGLQVTLRRKKMIDFLERLIKIVLPRVRDFSGIDLKSIDRKGVLNIGFREQFVFPEINPEESPVSFSLGVNIVPKEKNREKAIQNYKQFGLPLKK